MIVAQHVPHRVRGSRPASCRRFLHSHAKSGPAKKGRAVQRRAIPDPFQTRKAAPFPAPPRSRRHSRSRRHPELGSSVFLIQYTGISAGIQVRSLLFEWTQFSPVPVTTKRTCGHVRSYLPGCSGCGTDPGPPSAGVYRGHPVQQQLQLILSHGQHPGRFRQAGPPVQAEQGLRPAVPGFCQPEASAVPIAASSPSARAGVRKGQSTAVGSGSGVGPGAQPGVESASEARPGPDRRPPQQASPSEPWPAALDFPPTAVLRLRTPASGPAPGPAASDRPIPPGPCPGPCG